MSAAVISFEAEVRNLDSIPIQRSKSAPRSDTDVVDGRMLPKSGEGDRVCYEAACELDLVEAAKCGDQRAFVELHCRYRSLLKRRIRGMVRNLEDAEDVLQDTMISAF